MKDKVRAWFEILREKVVITSTWVSQRWGWAGARARAEFERLKCMVSDDLCK